MIKIKFCGLSRKSDIDYANETKPDYIGFVFAKNSRRCVLPDTAKELKSLLDDNISAVGVFVNEPIDNVINLLDMGVIDIAQLHGNETDEYINLLKKHCKKPVIKAYSIKGKDDIISASESSADYILLDSGKGGTGTTFDWSLIQDIKRPYFLAGGLDTDNIKTAAETIKPYAIDISSGIETDGVKDITKMKKITDIIRNLY